MYSHCSGSRTGQKNAQQNTETVSGNRRETYSVLFYGVFSEEPADPWKDIKELYQRIQVLVYDVYSSKCLLNCIKGNNSRALYRDSGLLIGWRLQSMQSANTKALKAYGRVVEALKK